MPLQIMENIDVSLLSQRMAKIEELLKFQKQQTEQIYQIVAEKRYPSVVQLHQLILSYLKSQIDSYNIFDQQQDNTKFVSNDGINNCNNECINSQQLSEQFQQAEIFTESQSEQHQLSKPVQDVISDQYKQNRNQVNSISSISSLKESQQLKSAATSQNILQNALQAGQIIKSPQISLQDLELKTTSEHPQNQIVNKSGYVDKTGLITQLLNDELPPVVPLLNEKMKSENELRINVKDYDKVIISSLKTQYISNQISKNELINALNAWIFDDDVSDPLRKEALNLLKQVTDSMI